MFWLELLVEVVIVVGCVVYGLVVFEDVSGFFDVGLFVGGQYMLYLGLIEEIGFFKNQECLIFVWVGIIDLFLLEDYLVYEGYVGLKNVLVKILEVIVQQMIDLGLCGWGGVVFLIGIKWQIVLCVLVV